MIRNYTTTFYLLLLSALCFLVYFPTFGNQFQLLWDDKWQIMNGYSVNGFTWNNIHAIFSESYYGQYSPVNQIIYTVIYYLFGYNPLVYHLYNLLLHLANVCLTFLLIQRILIYGKRADEKTVSIVSFTVALLFGIHPTQVEAVAWISASKVVLYSFFTLAALLAYLKYTDANKMKYYLLTLILFVLSFGSKEQAVVLPASLILLDWVMKRNLKDKNVWIEKIPFILFAFSFGLFTLSFQYAPAVKEWAGYTFVQRLFLASYALVEYVVKLALPVNLLYLYPFPMPPGDSLPLRMFIYPFLLIISVIWILIARKHWQVLFGVLFFLINIALTIHIAPMSRFMIVADRYLYLPSIGLFFTGVWYVVHYLRLLTKKKRQWYYVIIASYLLYLGIYAHQRTKVWYDSKTLKREIKELLQERNVSEETSENENKAP